MGREGSGLDRNPKFRPGMPNGADMIPVRMGEENAFQPVAAIFQPGIE